MPLLDVAVLYVPVILLSTAVIEFSGKYLILVIAITTVVVELYLYWIYP